MSIEDIIDSSSIVFYFKKSFKFERIKFTRREQKSVVFSNSEKVVTVLTYDTQLWMKQLNNPKRVKMLSNYPSDKKMTIYVKFNS